MLFIWQVKCQSMCCNLYCQNCLLKAQLYQLDDWMPCVFVCDKCVSVIKNKNWNFTKIELRIKIQSRWYDNILISETQYFVRLFLEIDSCTLQTGWITMSDYRLLIQKKAPKFLSAAADVIWYSIDLLDTFQWNDFILKCANKTIGMKKIWNEIRFISKKYLLKNWNPILCGTWQIYLRKTSIKLLKVIPNECELPYNIRFI